jgi:hypothetical protein
LVELLVVIGIIALLSTILAATLTRARESARRVACLSNLRQLGVAITLYANDTKGCFPHIGLWTPWIFGQEGNVLARYGMVPAIYQCPSDSPDYHRYPVPPLGNGYEYSYTGNWLIFAKGNYLKEHVGIRMSRVIGPSEKIIVIDESAETIDDCIWATRNGSSTGRTCSLTATASHGSAPARWTRRRR